MSWPAPSVAVSDRQSNPVNTGTTAGHGELLPANFMAWIGWIHAVCGKLVFAHCMTAASQVRGPLCVVSCCQPTSWLKTGSYSELHVFVLNLVIAERGSVLLTILPWTLGRCWAWRAISRLHGLDSLERGMASCCQPTSWTAGRGVLLSADFVAEKWIFQ